MPIELMPITNMNILSPAPDPIVGGLLLSPEALIAFVRQELGETDATIQAQMAKMKANKEKASFLQHASAELSGCKATKFENEKATLEKLIVEANNEGYADVAAQLEGYLASLSGKSGDLAAPDEEWLKGKITEIDAKVSELTSGTELDMINLQSLVERRSHTINFASKCIASLNDNVKNILGNIR